MSLYEMTELEVVRALHWPPHYTLMKHQMRRDEAASLVVHALPPEWKPWWVPRHSGPVAALEDAVLAGPTP